MTGLQKILPQLYLFEEDSVPYAADLEKARVVKLSPVMLDMVMLDILKLTEMQTDDAIVEPLKASYQKDDISETFEKCAAPELIMRCQQNLKFTPYEKRISTSRIKGCC